MSYEITNRALATQANVEARSQSALGKAANDIHRAKVLAVLPSGRYKVGTLDESGRVMRIYPEVMPPPGETFEAGDRVSVKVHVASEEAVILSSGGAGGCYSSFFFAALVE